MLYMMNEKSLSKVDSREELYQLLEQFVMAAREARRIGLKELRLHEAALPDLFKMNLHEQYSIDAWLKDSRVDHDLRDRFREIVTSTPLVKAEELEEFELYDRSEFYKLLEEKMHRVWGLGAAYIIGTLAISLNSHPEWQKTEVEIIHHYLDHDANIQEDSVLVRNFYSAESLHAHLNWWDQRQKDALRDSNELWDRRQEFFPGIELCGEVEKQLKAMGAAKELSQIVDRLKTLGRYAAGWKNGEFSYKDVNATTNLRISPESAATMRKFGSQRNFIVPGQGKKSFELHIKTGNLRFHFYPDNTAKKIYVGYIGKHLRIASED